MEITQGMRMYFFVMYNLSGIQKGIQAGHAALEYNLQYGDNELYREFVERHKTFILLDGGGSEDMINRANELHDFGIDYAGFNEPDLNYSLSAIAFIVPESIYNWEYDYEDKSFEASFEEKVSSYLRKFRLASN